MNAVEQCGPDYYISEYIKKEREFRVHCVQGRVVGVSEKHPPNREAIAWNFHGEDGNGEFINLKWSEWPMAVVNAALEAFKVSKLHFGAADVISVPGRALVLEINSAPSLSPYRASCYGRALSDSITKGRLRTDEYEPPVQPQTWKDALHPALME
jgi:glutathione synthase/RimK-type ligase-like ATP-grasp enzyme